ncbi:MAG: hypothetical protein WDM90_03850 [Ferruginibacter sp.]
MKKIILSIVILFLGVTAFAQQYDTTPPYLKNKTIPSFVLLSLDSIPFTQSVLVSGKKTIIMLFNPECEHCQHQLESMLTIMDVLDSVNIILTSTETLGKIKIFYDKYHLEKYPMIHIGKDFKYFFTGFYQPRTVPDLAFIIEKDIYYILTWAV